MLNRGCSSFAPEALKRPSPYISSASATIVMDYTTFSDIVFYKTVHNAIIYFCKLYSDIIINLKIAMVFNDDQIL